MSSVTCLCPWSPVIYVSRIVWHLREKKKRAERINRPCRRRGHLGDLVTHCLTGAEGVKCDWASTKPASDCFIYEKSVPRFKFRTPKRHKCNIQQKLNRFVLNKLFFFFDTVVNRINTVIISPPLLKLWLSSQFLLSCAVYLEVFKRKKPSYTTLELHYILFRTHEKLI